LWPPNLANWNNYNAQAILVTQTFAIIIARYFDRGFLELILGPFGLLRLFHYFSFTLELLATGLPHYALLLLIFISLSLFYVSLPLIFFGLADLPSFPCTALRHYCLTCFTIQRTLLFLLP
jgi:hypothetical protein